MQFEQELLPGAWSVRLSCHADERGTFVKTYARALFEQQGISFDFREEFYSLSRRDVIRGMHFQTPPHAHAKIVYCAAGAVEDVLLDLRPGPTFGRIATVELHGESPMLLFIPVGIAHGFHSLSDNSLMVYKTSTEHAPEHDCGVRWDSFGHDWRCTAPVMSRRDVGHPPLSAFETPFVAVGKSA